MTQYAILTDLNRCVGCMACMVSCKVINGVPIGSYWNKMLRIGPYKRKDYKTSNDVDMYYLNVQCQHCENPKCVEVCPTGASHKMADGTVQNRQGQVHRLPVLRHVLPRQRPLPQRGRARG